MDVLVFRALASAGHPRVRRGLLAVITVLGAALLTGPSISAAADVGGFGAYPALRAGQQRQSPYFAFRLTAGQTRTASAVIVNSSSRPIPVSVSAVRGLTGQTSGAVYANSPLGSSTDLRVVPAVSGLVLPAHSRRRVGLRITVSSRAQPGDHLAGLAIVDRHHPRSHGRFAVTEVIRVVIGVSVRVAGPVSAGLRIGTITAGPLGGTADAALQIPITNVGRLYCRPRITVSLRQAGHRAIVQSRQLDTILPGDRISFPMAWIRPLLAGHYATAVTARGCGSGQRVGQMLRVAVSRRGTAALPAPSGVLRAAPAGARAAMQWPIIAGVGLGGLLVGLLLSRMRRRPVASPRSPAASAGVTDTP